MKILTLNNPKITKGTWQKWVTAIINFLPGDISGYEVCKCRSEHCFEHCFARTGYYLRFKNTWEARMERTKLFFENRELFMNLLEHEIAILKYKLEPDQQLAIRPNGGSDILWEKDTTLIQDHPDIQFYDYSKWPLMQRMRYNWPKNYHLTYSFNGNNKLTCIRHLKAGYNVAIPHRNYKEMTNKMLRGYKCINGENDDLRFLDPSPCWVLLKPKATLISDKKSLMALK